MWLKGNLGTYGTEDRERVGMRLIVRKPKILGIGTFANATLGRLLGCSSSKEKPEVQVIWPVAPKSITKEQVANLIWTS